MESASLTIDKVHVLCVNIGEDVLLTIQKFILEKGIKQAIILNGYGALMRYQIHWVLHNQLPSKPVNGSGEGGIEMVSMSGIVLDGNPHVHITLANQGGAFGGHMEVGCIAYVICEVFIAEATGAHLGHIRLPVSLAGVGEGTTYHLTVSPE
jgi:predicted DNA-binding protein with PD1-like motif